MESTRVFAGNNLNENIDAIVDNLGRHLELLKVDATDNLSTVKAKIEKVFTLIWKENKRRAQINTMLTKRKWDLEQSMPKLKYMRYFSRYDYRNNRTVRIEKLQQALTNCSGSHSITNKDANMKRLYHQLQKCSNLKEERQILKEIQQVEEKSVSEDEMKSIFEWEWSYWGMGTPTNSKEVLRERINETLNELKLASDRRRIVEEEKLKKEIEQAKNDIRSYRAQLEQINKNKATLYELVLQLKKQLGKSCHFQPACTYP